VKEYGGGGVRGWGVREWATKCKMQNRECKTQNVETVSPLGPFRPHGHWDLVIRFPSAEAFKPPGQAQWRLIHKLKVVECGGNEFQPRSQL
jgi:hypothetical protein